MYSKDFLNKYIEQYYFDGFVVISSYKKQFKKFFEIIDEINSDINLFEIKKKNKSTLTLKQDLLPKEKKFYLENILYDLGIVELANSITCRNLQQTNFIHFLSNTKIPSLPWHRDTYKTFGKVTGAVPSATKIAIYSSNVTKYSAPMELIPGSHRFDCQNRFIDRVQPFFFNKYVMKANKGDLIIFDSSILHRRASCRKNKFRSTTIFGLIPKNGLV